MKKNNFLAQAESLLGHFKPLDMSCVHDLMDKLCHLDTLIQDEFGCDTTVSHLCGRQIDSGADASRVRIKFYGGPLGHGRFFRGTLVTYLIDCVATKIQMEGFTRARILLGVRKRRGRYAS